MGNRGCLHDGDGNLIKKWVRKAWVICLLEYKGRHRQIMSPGQYTELFFLDEVTALAAGHRPCGTCQKSRYEIFKQLWIRANIAELGKAVSSIQDIDEHLHAERHACAGNKAIWTSKLSDLPDGVMVTTANAPGKPLLFWRSRLYLWTPEGYEMAVAPSDLDFVNVITSKSIVRALSNGYWPNVHPTAESPVESQYSPQSIKNTKPKPINPRRRRHATEQSDSNAQAVLSVPVSGQLYKLEKTPAGNELFTYFAAILRVTGMDRGAIFPLKKFLGNFSIHEKAGRIEKVGSGYRLTPAGMDYFADRFRAGSRQHVDELDVQSIVKQIQMGGDGWKSIQ